MGMIGELIGTIAAFVPWWVLVIAAVVLGGLAAPGYFVGLKVKKVKARMRKTVRADEAERAAIQREVYELAKDSGDVLVALAKEADKLNQPRLRDRAVQRLRKLGTHPDEVRKLTGPTDPREDKRLNHPLEAAAAVRALIEVEAWEAAKARLDEAQARFPDDDELHALREQVATGAASLS